MIAFVQQRGWIVAAFDGSGEVGGGAGERGRHRVAVACRRRRGRRPARRRRGSPTIAWTVGGSSPEAGQGAGPAVPVGGLDQGLVDRDQGGEAGWRRRSGRAGSRWPRSRRRCARGRRRGPAGRCAVVWPGWVRVVGVGQVGGDVGVVGVAAAGHRDVERLAGHAGPDEGERDVGGEALGAVHGGGVAELRRARGRMPPAAALRPTCRAGWPVRSGAVRPLRRTVIEPSGWIRVDGPQVAVADPGPGDWCVSRRSLCSGDDLVPDPGAAVVVQRHRRPVRPSPWCGDVAGGDAVGLGAGVERGDGLVVGGDQHRRAARRRWRAARPGRPPRPSPRPGRRGAGRGRRSRPGRGWSPRRRPRLAWASHRLRNRHSRDSSAAPVSRASSPNAPPALIAASWWWSPTSSTFAPAAAAWVVSWSRVRVPAREASSTITSCPARSRHRSPRPGLARRGRVAGLVLPLGGGLAARCRPRRLAPRRRSRTGRARSPTPARAAASQPAGRRAGCGSSRPRPARPARRSRRPEPTTARDRGGLVGVQRRAADRRRLRWRWRGVRWCRRRRPAAGSRRPGWPARCSAVSWWRVNALVPSGRRHAAGTSNRAGGSSRTHCPSRTRRVTRSSSAQPVGRCWPSAGRGWRGRLRRGRSTRFQVARRSCKPAQGQSRPARSARSR